MNPLLERQLRQAGLAATAPPSLERWQELLTAIGLSYDDCHCGRACAGRAIAASGPNAPELLPMQKLAAIERLAPGIAHEINTPIQFIGDNVRFLELAMADVVDLCDRYRQAVAVGRAWTDDDERTLGELEASVDLPFLRTEIPSAVRASGEGLARVAAIAEAIRIFAAAGPRQAPVDLSVALQSVLVAARNEIKYVATVVCDLRPIPPVVCNIGELNLVFLRLAMSAADAVRARHGTDPSIGRLDITVDEADGYAVITIADNGTATGGEESRDRQAGLTDGGRQGRRILAPSLAMVVEQHRGRLTWESKEGGGSVVVVRLPLNGVTDPAALQPDPTATAGS